MISVMFTLLRPPVMQEKRCHPPEKLKFLALP